MTVVLTGGHSAGHQAVIVRGTGDGARTLAFFGDLLMRPWAANPRWVTSFDDFPLDSVTRKVELFTQAVEEDWIVVLSHEARHPVGRLVRDRDRFPLRGRASPVNATAGSPRSARPRRPVSGAPTIDRITPFASMNTCVGRPYALYAWKILPEPSKPMV